MAKARLHKNTSTFGRNMALLMLTYGLSIEDIMSMSKNKIKDYCFSNWNSKIDADYPWYAELIREMLEMKDGRCIRTFMNEDCNCIIDHLCTI